MKVLIVSSEIVPYAKTGGLADVTGTLPKVLKGVGVEADCIMPKYSLIDDGKFGIKPAGVKVKVPLGHREEEGEIYETEGEWGGKVYFVKNDRYYDREYLYATKDGDYVDNAERFIFFARAVLEFLLKTESKYDIIHCNDWQTGLIPVYIKTLYSGHPLFSETATVFTVHNLGYQGLFWSHDMPLTGLGWEMFTPKALEFYGKINFLKGGLVFSDVITTVSEKYAQEIQTEEFGFGLEGVLFERREDLYGILNGVDYEVWNPEIDPHLVKNYSLSDLEGKKECKKDLLSRYDLPQDEDTPVIGVVSRLVAQKGFDLLHEIGEKLAALDVRFVVLGTGERKYEEFFLEMERKYPEKFRARITYDEVLAHKIEGGADMFLMPSRYEPCGLNQIYSLRYGTIPIVRNTGGLADTVVDVDSDRDRGTGFTFDRYDPGELFDAIVRAISWYHKKDEWEKIVKRAMSQDFSWDRSARKYREVYEKALSKKRWS
ncbi:MAG: glycogen synthase GlgA [Deltaproteobacteria bacterium]|nr:MAG: glycogen synthase GlgA [Deltaproteobacteria bacterium]